MLESARYVRVITGIESVRLNNQLRNERRKKMGRTTKPKRELSKNELIKDAVEWAFNGFERFEVDFKKTVKNITETNNISEDELFDCVRKYIQLRVYLKAAEDGAFIKDLRYFFSGIIEIVGLAEIAYEIESDCEDYGLNIPAKPEPPKCKIRRLHEIKGY